MSTRVPLAMPAVENRGIAIQWSEAPVLGCRADNPGARYRSERKNGIVFDMQVGSGCEWLGYEPRMDREKRTIPYREDS
jgi:hypothetical protein